MVETPEQRVREAEPISPATSAIGRVFRHFAALCLLGLFLTLLAGTALRYLPGTTDLQTWVPGITILLQVWLVFLGSVAAVASLSHLRFTLLVDSLPRRAGSVVRAGVWLVRMATLLVLLIASKSVVVSGFDATIGGVAFTKGYVYSVLPVALIAMIALELLILLQRRHSRATA